MNTDIKPYIYERSKVNGFDFYKYLHIKGGAGRRNRKHRMGGEFDFILFYAMPEEMKEELLRQLAQMFLNPSNQDKADLETDKHVFQALGEKLQSFPFQETEYIKQLLGL